MMIMSSEYDCDGCGNNLDLGEFDSVDHLLERQRAAMERRGWFAHIVSEGDPTSPTGFNYHTHGFDQSLDHLDIQIVLPLDPVTCHAIAGTIFDRIRGGDRFKAGERASEIITNFDVTFVKVRENDRDVLRVILPGTNGGLEPMDLGDDEEPVYSLQWTETG